MRFKDGKYLQLDKWYDKIYAPSRKGGIGDELDVAFFMAGIKKSEIQYDKGDEIDLKDNEAIWIWAHGNKHRGAIGSGKDETFSPGKVAEGLSAVAKKSKGHIVVWSCWAGTPGGFSEHFAAIMRAQGYMSLRFWGALHPTGTLIRSNDGNQWADVLVQVNAINGDGRGPRPAERTDVMAYGAGEKKPFWRSLEAP